jgi:hypothetical protein
MQEILHALANGALLLTANRRLARHWRMAFDAAQVEAGREAWPAPEISAWPDWIADVCERKLSGRVLPSAMAERRGWERVIRDAGDGEPLLDVAATAAAASNAWALCKQYRISLRHPAFDDAADTARFRNWALDWERRVERRQWLPEAERETWLAESMPESMGREVWLDGFDEFTPLQSELVEKLKGRRVRGDRARASAVALHICDDARAEAYAAACWARTRLERDGKKHVGVVVQDLASLRPAIEGIFEDVLGKPLFNISLGLPLTEWPVVADALALLRWITGPLPVGEAGALLRSPFVRGGNSAAEMDARERNRLDVTLAQAGWAGIAAPERLTPGAWARAMPRLLERFGWPGDRGLSSAERQAVARFEKVLREFAALDVVDGPMGFREALRLFSDACAEAVFQPETPEMPVQILEALQAAGSSFDALWVMGMTDTNWPAPAKPHPFVPRSLQRAGDLPHATPERELRFAREITERLLASAPEVIFSAPRREAELALRPSRLIAALPAWTPDSEVFESVTTALACKGAFEQFADDAAPALGEEKITGGTGILAWQSVCPFKAFASARLGAGEFPEPSPGIPPFERGSKLHDALKYVWERFQTMAAMRSATDAERQRVIDEALVSHGNRKLDEVERQCMKLRLEQMIELDFERGDFEVVEMERAVDFAGQGIGLRGRIDRIDLLPGGERVIIDYKSTAPSTKVWHGERPDNPQLPLYAIAIDPPPAAIAFASLKRGEVKYKGAGQSEKLIAGVEPGGLGWSEQLEEWRRVTRALWDEFASGQAAVTPKKKACDTCHLHSLCRIHEQGVAIDDDAS